MEDWSPRRKPRKDGGLGAFHGGFQWDQLWLRERWLKLQLLNIREEDKRKKEIEKDDVDVTREKEDGDIHCRGV